MSKISACESCFGLCKLFAKEVVHVRLIVKSLTVAYVPSLPSGKAIIGCFSSFLLIEVDESRPLSCGLFVSLFVLTVERSTQKNCVTSEP